MIIEPDELTNKPRRGDSNKRQEIIHINQNIFHRAAIIIPALRAL